jgi:GAF domain-containing protein
MHGQLAREFAATAGQLDHQTEMKEIFETVLDLALIAIDCRHVGLLLCAGPGRLESRGATDSATDEADRLQIALRQGPCWSCMARAAYASAVLVDDTATERRWSAWNPHLAELGLRSALSARLDTPGTTVGVLNLYDFEPHRFNDESVACAQVLALHAATALADLVDA